jgi:hypothetical protein
MLPVWMPICQRIAREQRKQRSSAWAPAATGPPAGTGGRVVFCGSAGQSPQLGSRASTRSSGSADVQNSREMGEAEKRRRPRARRSAQCSPAGVARGWPARRQSQRPRCNAAFQETMGLGAAKPDGQPIRRPVDAKLAWPTPPSPLHSRWLCERLAPSLAGSLTGTVASACTARAGLQRPARPAHCSARAASLLARRRPSADWLAH